MECRAFLLLSACLALYATEAMACTPSPPLRIEFQDDSTNLAADALSAMDSILGTLRSHGPKCASFAIYAYSQDETGHSRSVAEARADKIKRALVNFGAEPELIKTSVEARGGRRHVNLASYGTSGRTYCDPTSKIQTGSTCGALYTRCYVQLKDGTICNYGNVPDPNPIQYSVTP